MKHVIKMKTGRHQNEDGFTYFDCSDVIKMKTSLLTIPIKQTVTGISGRAMTCFPADQAKASPKSQSEQEMQNSINAAKVKIAKV